VAVSPTATWTLVATPTTAPTATTTPTPLPCIYNAALVKHVTAPDGAPMLPNQPFAKTWQVQNNGTCPWTSGFTLAFAGGELMGGAQAAAIAGTVAPGQVADLTLNMTAPGSFGGHKGTWQLRDSNGVYFGADLPVRIVTVPNPPTAAITAPSNGFQTTQGATVRVTFEGVSEAAVASISLYANNTLLSQQAPAAATMAFSADFDWQPLAGDYDLYVITLDAYGQQGESVHIKGSVTQK
jgi:hypothetical protein